ncbi:hypothetical protein [Actinomadura verrucosospora]|uniref:Homoserine kinase n=1 Tax=Actinomadura verrucosospora TaxID=46165 RepID=A0A7D3VPT0_ACTVE|nr:hypothetical protein [Actinomadura verrucosospora]QKG19760.1 homoserine kinase [Actinomadura verrucosospora]
MPFIDTPLPAPMRHAVQDAWGRRFDGEAEWCHAVAAHAAATLPEAVVPLPARDGATVVQLIRHRLRREAAYFEHARRRGAVHDEDDLDYHERRVKTRFALRP